MTVFFIRDLNNLDPGSFGAEAFAVSKLESNFY